MTITIPFNEYANDFLDVLDQDNCLFVNYTRDLSRPNAIGILIGVTLLHVCRSKVHDNFVI